MPDHGAIGPGAREIGRKNRKGKNFWRVKTTSHGHGCNSASASPALPSLFLSSLLPSLSLPFLSSAQARSKTLAHCTLPRCQLFPPRVLSLAFSLSPGFHSSLSSSVWSKSATAQVGSLCFFVPKPRLPKPPSLASPRLASPRRRCRVLVCAAQISSGTPVLLLRQPAHSARRERCWRERPSPEPHVWHQAVCTSLAGPLPSALCLRPVTDAPRLGSSVISVPSANKSPRKIQTGSGPKHCQPLPRNPPHSTSVFSRL